MIPLMKNAFMDEYETKKKLCDFILKTDKLSMGDQCLEFEARFAARQERKHAVLFNSGGSANLAILQAMKNLERLKDGAKVGFTALTWSTNVMPIIQLGMTPQAIDVERDTLNVMAATLKDYLQNHELDAFFLTNVLGYAGDLDKIREVCHEHDVLLLEDNCEALGSALKDGKTGNFSVASSFSFFVAHHMSTIEGGMACTDDDDVAEMLKIVRANGWDRNLQMEQQIRWRKKYNIKSEFQAKYTFYDLGYNLRPTEITGFLGLVQLDYLESNIVARKNNYLHLKKIISENPELITLDDRHMTVLSPFATPVVCKSPELREKYISQFSGAGIEIRPMIAGNMINQPFYKKYFPGDNPHLPGTDFLDRCSFYCGNYPELSKTDLTTIGSCLSNY